MLVLLLLLPCPSWSDIFPTKMLGSYQLETSEGFTDLMYELGVSWFTRQVDHWDWTQSGYNTGTVTDQYWSEFDLWSFVII